jgi:hypothetical protein
MERFSNYSFNQNSHYRDEAFMVITRLTTGRTASDTFFSSAETLPFRTSHRKLRLSYGLS